MRGLRRGRSRGRCPWCNFRLVKDGLFLPFFSYDESAGPTLGLQMPNVVDQISRRWGRILTVGTSSTRFYTHFVHTRITYTALLNESLGYLFLFFRIDS